SRAEGQWVLGDAAAALRTLRAGVPPEIADTLPVPDALATPPGAPPLALAGGLIGHPTLNLLLGAEALRALGRPEAEAWRAAAP
ncbi:MAG: hypothetical protein KC620_15615, partial [Myxococcales bacterium]|nr:hypothetical protein [Myxococcales bacterium]